MTSGLSLEDEENIRKKLIELGFNHDQEMFETAHQFKIGAGNGQVAAVEMDDFNTSDDTRFNLVFVKDPLASNWIMYLMDVTLDATDLLQSGEVHEISLNYSLEKEAMPTKDEANKAMTVQVDKIKMLQQIRNSQTLRSEFKKMGFDDLNEMSKKVAFHSNLAYLKSNKPISLLAEHIEGLVNFEFIIVFPKNDKQPYVGMVTANLLESENLTNIIRSAIFIRNGEGLPAKKLMIQQLAEGMGWKPDMYDNIRAMFKMGDNSPPANAVTKIDLPKKPKF